MSEKINSVTCSSFPVTRENLMRFKKYQKMINKILKNKKNNQWRKIKLLKSELNTLFLRENSVEAWFKQNYLIKKLKKLSHCDNWSYRQQTETISRSKQKKLISKLQDKNTKKNKTFAPATNKHT